FHTMYNDQHEALATAEKLFLSYHLKQKKVIDFNGDFHYQLEQWQNQQGEISMPSTAGQGISLTKQ
ncbi:MAG: hypothetical protein ACPH27_07180, partial [Pseudomonadales bacterium]